MTAATEAVQTFDRELAPNGVSAAAGMGRVRAVLGELAPYALIELLLPGGTLLAIAYWLYRRYKHRCAMRAALYASTASAT